MAKKLTITLDDRVYEGLHATVGRARISRFIEALVRPHVVGKAVGQEDLAAGYRAKSEDKEHEAEALEWIEAMIGDAADEER